MMDPDLNLSKDTILKMCKGNVKALPRFVVHTDEAWPWYNRVRVDKQNRIHIRRSTFLRTVAKDLPVTPGLWIRVDAQEFSIDLQQHDLQGGDDQQSDNVNQQPARTMAKADAHGRLPDEADYQAPVADTDRQRVDSKDLAEVAARDERGSVQSTAFVDIGTE